jgi:hypothetical protein
LSIYHITLRFMVRENMSIRNIASAEERRSTGARAGDRQRFAGAIRALSREKHHLPSLLARPGKNHKKTSPWARLSRLSHVWPCRARTPSHPTQRCTTGGTEPVRPGQAQRGGQIGGTGLGKGPPSPGSHAEETARPSFVRGGSPRASQCRAAPHRTDLATSGVGESSRH